MRNRKMLLQALLCVILVAGLILPAIIAGAPSVLVHELCDSHTLIGPLEDGVISSGLADSPWPKFGQNEKNTGKSPYVGPEIPELKWTFEISQGYVSPAIGADGTIYVGDTKLYAINPDGSEKWTLTSASEDMYGCPAIGVDGAIYVGSHSPSNNLFAINADGSVRWSFAAPTGIGYRPTIAPDGTVYVGSTYPESALYAINADGSFKWSYATGDAVFYSAAIGDDGVVYFSADRKVFAVDADGSFRWSYDTKIRGSPSAPAIGHDGTIYVGSAFSYFDGLVCEIHAINPDGSLKWRYPEGGGVSSPAIGDDGTIYVGSWDHKVYAMNPDGSLKWSFTTGYYVYSSPAIGADGTIYVGSLDGKFYAINPDGSEKWSFAIGGEVRSSPAIGADGTIYVCSNNGKLYAIGEAALPPTIPRFLTLPFKDPDIKIQQGWIYTWDPNPNAHQGIDYIKGTIDSSVTWQSFDVVAAADGWAMWSEQDGSTGVYGKFVFIRHDEKDALGDDYFTLYAHLDSTAAGIPYQHRHSIDYDYNDTSKWKSVETGETIGRAGETGATAIHLHFEAQGGGYYQGRTDPYDLCKTRAFYPSGGNYTGSGPNHLWTTDPPSLPSDPSPPPPDEEEPPSICFIATAAYGTPMAEEIQILREFRDGYLLTNPLGQVLVDLYYSLSPPIAQFINDHPILKPIVRAALVPVVAISAIVVNTTLAEKIAIVGSLVLISVAVAIWMTRRRSSGVAS